MSQVLVLRPQPAAGETASRAAALGLRPVVAPLFVVAPVPWSPPRAAFDAILFTSANGARLAGMAPDLPCYAVGEATAAAAREAGFAQVRAGPSDGAAVAALMAADGVGRALHLCGRDHIAVAAPGVEIERRIVYRAEAVSRLPDAAQEALAAGALVLLHSARSAALFAALAGERSRLRIAAISAAAAEAAGAGWAERSVAVQPRDEALLELAMRLCHIAPPEAAAAGT